MTNQFVFYLLSDEEPPVFANLPPKELNQMADPGVATATVTWTEPTVTDNSGAALTVSSNYQSGDKFILGITPVIYSAVDSHGNNATYSFNVIIEGWSFKTFM